MSVVGKVLNTIILLRLQGAVDATLKDRQAGFRKDHSCIDQLATLRIIIEQSIEWNTSLYVNFVGFEKAFDSLHRSFFGALCDTMAYQENSFESSKIRTIRWLAKSFMLVDCQRALRSILGSSKVV